MAGLSNNGSSELSFFKMPEIKFTKLFINGEFVDAVSGLKEISKAQVGFLIASSLIGLSKIFACTRTRAIRAGQS
ncbi:hypothetical protein WN944_000797 [Citrus x changshan-huyou]|uniref:Uncharacterized protein n=1 Tax=Citrus x changshan-huyou TaxID=2935761 RepID=A0AAP0MI07_9ROSI